VNPYDIKSTGEAIAQALQMNVGNMAERMRRMRNSVKEQNIYWWAGSLIGALCELRLEQAESASSFVPDRIPVEM
jgi:trehalose 6-phosphate synthase